MNSKRKYKVCISDQVGITIEHSTVETLLNSPADYEYLYAMREVLDRILDLKVGESIYFQPNRDDKNTKGIVYRVS